MALFAAYPIYSKNAVSESSSCHGDASIGRSTHAS